MALKLIQQDVATLREAYDERKTEYDGLRSLGKWSGAILLAGTLLELALKIAMCKHLDVEKLPIIFQVHDLELLLYCSGHQKKVENNPALQKNFMLIHKKWSLTTRYEGATKNQQDADDFDQALFDCSFGVIAFLTRYF